MSTRHLLGLLAVITLAAGIASAISMPNEMNTVTFTATVSEQCDVSLPVAVQFNVSSLSVPTNASAPAPVSIINIVLANGHKIRLSLAPNTAQFSKPTGASITWNSTDVSWDAGTWTGGSGTAGSMMDLPHFYYLVVTSNANATSLSTGGLNFTLAANTSIDHAGDYTLTATWRIESSL